MNHKKRYIIILKYTDMREIKFRGQTINGHWVFGSFIDNGSYDFPCIYCGGNWVDVCNNSVGQFTGLTDKNGKEIYEGDILLSQGQYKKFIQVVEFHNTDKTCGRGWVGVNHIQIELINGVEIKTKKSDRFSYFSFPCLCEIIGNIHNNPDLLKL